MNFAKSVSLNLSAGGKVGGNLEIDGDLTVNGDSSGAYDEIINGHLDLADNNILNVGDISLDTISSDAGTSINVVLGSDAGDDFLVDTDKLVVEGDTGKVGIGTASPAYPLDIVSTINNGAALAIRGDVDSDGRFSGIQFGDNGTTSYSKGGIFYEGKDAYARGNLHFALEGGTGTDNADLSDARMTITYDGNVGIGTDDPDSILHIKGGANWRPIFKIENTSTGNESGIIQFHKVASDSSEADNDYLGGIDFYGINDNNDSHRFAYMYGISTDVSDGSEDGRIDFMTAKNGTDTVTMTLKSGNVGIGTNDPAVTTHIHSDAETFAYVTTDSGSHDTGIWFGHDIDGTAAYTGIVYDRSVYTLKLFNGNSIANHLVINNDGDVGVGVESPNTNCKMHIRGGDSGQTSSSNNTQLTIENSATAGIQLLTGTTNVGGIWVGDSNGSETGGKLYYSNSSDGWTFFNQGSVQSCDIGLSMVNLYNNDTGSAGSTLKQLSLGTSDNTALDFTNVGTIGGVIVSNSSNTDDSACGVVFSHRSSSSGISYVASRNEGADRSALYFGTRGSDGVALRMEIRNDGIMVSKKGLIFDGSALGSGQTGISSSGSGGDLLLFSNGTAHARLQSTGRFVIGTTSANAKLHIHETVNGQETIFLNHSVTGSNQTYLQFRHDGTLRGHIQINDSTDQIMYNTTSSDKRLKKDFEDWDEDVLPYFKSLKPQLFNFIHSENNGGKRKGYIAQDNVDNFPEAYPKSKSVDGDDTEYYSFNPTGMVSYLMKAVKELTEKVEALENA